MWSTSRNGKKTHHQKLLQLKDAWYWKSFVSLKIGIHGGKLEIARPAHPRVGLVRPAVIP